MKFQDKIKISAQLAELLEQLKKGNLGLKDKLSKSQKRITLLKELGQKVPDLGRTSYVVTAKGDEVKTGFKLVEASKLIPSNTDDGRINPDFPQELQPRDRTRVSSLMQISKISQNLRPAQLADSGLSSHGAPIIGPDNVVESGNGRSLAIIKAYKTGKAEDYKNYLIENAGLYGFTPEKVAQMNQPVLVRERLTEVDRAKFAKDSNLSDLQQMSAAETAFSDAERIDNKLMDQFQPSEAGNLMAPSNKGFVNSFLTEIGDNSTAGLLTEDGRPTKQLIERMQNAVFAKAYKNEKLVKLVAEEADPEIRNILNALNGAASAFVEMQYLDGEVHKQTSDQIADAISIKDKDAIPTIETPAGQYEDFKTKLDDIKHDKTIRSKRNAEQKLAISIGKAAIESDKGQHEFAHIRGMEGAAIYKNPDRMDTPIVLSKSSLKSLAAHAISPAKLTAISKLSQVLTTMKFSDEKVQTDHNQDKHTGVKHWENAKVNMVINGRPVEVGVQLRYMENGLQTSDSLSPYGLWDKDEDMIVEDTASVRGDLPLGGAESRFRSKQHLNINTNNVQPDAMVVNYLEVTDITISEPKQEPEKQKNLAAQALDSLVQATELVRQAKDSGQNIDELLAQSGLFGDNDPEVEALARFISCNNRSAKRLTTAFKSMANAINDELQHQGRQSVTCLVVETQRSSISWGE